MVCLSCSQITYPQRISALLVQKEYTGSKLTFFTFFRPTHSPSFHLPHPLVSEAVKDEHPCKKYSKIICLFIAWLFIMGLLTSKSEKKEFIKHLSVPSHKPKFFNLPNLPESNNIGVSLYGAFLPDDFSNMSANYLTVYLQGVTSDLETNETDKNQVVKVRITFLALKLYFFCYSPSLRLGKYL